MGQVRRVAMTCVRRRGAMRIGGRINQEQPGGHRHAHIAEPERASKGKVRARAVPAKPEPIRRKGVAQMCDCRKPFIKGDRIGVFGRQRVIEADYLYPGFKGQIGADMIMPLDGPQHPTATMEIKQGLRAWIGARVPAQADVPAIAADRPIVGLHSIR